MKQNVIQKGLEGDEIEPTLQLVEETTNSATLLFPSPRYARRQRHELSILGWDQRAKRLTLRQRN